jgi:cadmium resistance protein CadD (predicted permease)
MEILATIFVAVMAFVATNLDDLILLTVFFANNDYSNLSIVLGQYLGVSLLLIICAMAYFFKFIIPPQYLAIFGILPIAIGLKNLLNLRNDNLNHKYIQMDSELKVNVKKAKSSKKAVQVASTTFANGGDNIGIYIPLFISVDIFQITTITIIFFVMIGLWCFISYYMVKNRIIGFKLQKYGHLILPFVLITIGIGVLTGVWVNPIYKL